MEIPSTQEARQPVKILQDKREFQIFSSPITPTQQKNQHNPITMMRTLQCTRSLTPRPYLSSQQDAVVCEPDSHHAVSCVFCERQVCLRCAKKDTLLHAAVKLPSDEKEIVSENDEDRLDEQNVPEDGERCSNPRSVAVAMKTTMSSESETKKTQPFSLSISTALRSRKEDPRRIAGTRKKSRKECDGGPR
jgi:hypothetical protein